ncbi:class I SAM-dependent methyltransferase [Megasphaera sueciensis]|jgi:ubiquinone/menaquinone biosynthesis C-methylase UbiE|uniref:class I SAM-dependent methyltransferase n=1 Tax=Megasphaera sueciensis TaxID=349094 RepID=UPI003D05DFA2|nr:class I SAM-dependent methyltransferase [Megasphaera sp.]
MNRHPGGDEHTKEMLRLASVTVPARILDMGAGDGQTVRLLRNLGFYAQGIDLISSTDVTGGDFLHTPYDAGSFDVILSQCSFFVSGRIQEAFAEAYRVVKLHGFLLYSDVGIRNSQGPIDSVVNAGFHVICFQDMTDIWRRYYAECLWRGKDISKLYCPIPGKKYGYYMLICRKEG